MSGDIVPRLRLGRARRWHNGQTRARSVDRPSLDRDRRCPQEQSQSPVAMVHSAVLHRGPVEHDVPNDESGIRRA